MPQDRHAPRPTIVDELIATLAPHPRGLRRWSVMRAIRTNRQAASRDIPFKLESDVERVFRQFCRDSAMPAASPVLFCRPAEKAGEVWALDSFFAGAAAPDSNSEAAVPCTGEQRIATVRPPAANKNPAGEPAGLKPGKSRTV